MHRRDFLKLAPALAIAPLAALVPKDVLLPEYPQDAGMEVDPHEAEYERLCAEFHRLEADPRAHVTDVLDYWHRREAWYLNEVRKSRTECALFGTGTIRVPPPVNWSAPPP